MSDHGTPPPDEGFREFLLHNWPIFSDQFVRITALVPLWGVLQLKVMGLTPGEIACLIQTILTHKCEHSVHKSALKGSSIITPDVSWSSLKNPLGTVCVKSFLLAPHLG